MKNTVSNCITCGDTIDQKPGAGRIKLYCSEICRRGGNKQNQELICRTCGLSFEKRNTVGPASKYCSNSCRASDKTSKRKNPDLPSLVSCPVCQKQFERKGRQIFCSKACQRRESGWRRKYDLSISDYRHYWEWQEGKCAICDNQAENFGDLYVDHDHYEGHVRGLLCSYCNTGLGMFGDNVYSLQSAIRYLENTHKWKDN